MDGALHAIAFAPPDALGGGFLTAPVASAQTAFHVSAVSLRDLATAVTPLMPDGGAIVGLDFDASVAWPVYDWMGVAKAALEATARYLARDLGPQRVRVNLVSAGPLETVAARGIPGFGELADRWAEQAPLGWDTEDPSSVAGTIAFLLSDLARSITGQVVKVDGGFSAVGAPSGAQLAERREELLADVGVGGLGRQLAEREDGDAQRLHVGAAAVAAAQVPLEAAALAPAERALQVLRGQLDELLAGHWRRSRARTPPGRRGRGRARGAGSPAGCPR